MTHEDTERFLEQLAKAWPRDSERDAMLAELRDHLLAIEEDDSLATEERESALLAALAECGDARRLAEQLRGDIQQRKRRWIMRVSTAAAVAGIAGLLGIATYWPSPTPTPLVAVAVAQAPAGPGAAPGSASPVVVITNGQDANNQATQTKLAERIEAEFIETPFVEVIGVLGEKLGIETYINRRALQQADIPLDANVTVELKQVRGDMLLDLVLQQVGNDDIDYVVRDGIVVITSVASLDGASEVKAYPVADLLRLHQLDTRSATAGMSSSGEGGTASAAGGTPPSVVPGMPDGSFGGGGGMMMGGFGGPVTLVHSDLPPEVQQLVKVLQNSVAPDTWSELGGHGAITYYGEMLIVRQNARTHREIDKVLTMLRETAARRPGKHG